MYSWVFIQIILIGEKISLGYYYKNISVIGGINKDAGQITLPNVVDW